MLTDKQQLTLQNILEEHKDDIRELMVDCDVSKVDRTNLIEYHAEVQDLITALQAAGLLCSKSKQP